MKLSIVSVSLALVVGSVVVVGCAATVDEPTAQTAEAVTAPTACLTEPLCSGLACNAGVTLSPGAPGTGNQTLFSGASSSYGTASCQGSFVLELPHPSQFTAAPYATVSVDPWYSDGTIGPADCATARVSVLLYRHTQAGWDTTPWQPPLTSIGEWVGNTCAFGTQGTGGFLQNLGGATSDVDLLRIVVGGAATSGTDVPVYVRVNACTPFTCATAGSCGTVADGCGGTISCACPPPGTCGGRSHPKQQCPAPTKWTCCGTDGWECGPCQ